MKILSKSNLFIFGYFDPIIIFLIIKMNNFWGDLSDISARTATLVRGLHLSDDLASKRKECGECVDGPLSDPILPKLMLLTPE